MGIVVGGGSLSGRMTGRGGTIASRAAMLSVPTLWTVFVINFLALGLIWAYVMRSYPPSRPRGSGPLRPSPRRLAHRWRCCTSSCRIRCVPLLSAGTVLILAACLAAMGIRRVLRRPVSWRDTVLDHGVELCRPGLLHFRLRQRADADPDLFDRASRLPLVLTPEAVAVPHDGRDQPRRPARRASSPFSSSPLCHPAPWRGAAASRRRFLDLPVQPVAVGAGSWCWCSCRWR